LKYSKASAAVWQELVKQNGRQALLLGAVLIIVELFGFIQGLIQRLVIKRANENEVCACLCFEEMHTRTHVASWNA
jgi:hypothetical protein